MFSGSSWVTGIAEAAVKPENADVSLSGESWKGLSDGVCLDGLHGESCWDCEDECMDWERMRSIWSRAWKSSWLRSKSGQTGEENTFCLFLEGEDIGERSEQKLASAQKVFQSIP